METMETAEIKVKQYADLLDNAFRALDHIYAVDVLSALGFEVWTEPAHALPAQKLADMNIYFETRQPYPHMCFTVHNEYLFLGYDHDMAGAKNELIFYLTIFERGKAPACYKIASTIIF